MKISIPSGFKSLQVASNGGRNWLSHNQYHFRNSGPSVGITRGVWASFGFQDDTLWVHPTLPARLSLAAENLRSRSRSEEFPQGLCVMIKDAWRPITMYKHIISHHRRSGTGLADMFSAEAMPHATGMAVDAILADPVTKQPVWTRNQRAHGKASCFVNFYRGKNDPESRRFQKLQDLLVWSFLSAGFHLGGKQEYWHFELPGIDDAPRFWSEKGS